MWSSADIAGSSRKQHVAHSPHSEVDIGDLKCLELFFLTMQPTIFQFADHQTRKHNQLPLTPTVVINFESVVSLGCFDDLPCLCFANHPAANHRAIIPQMAAILKKLGGYKAQTDNKAPLRPKAVLLDVNGTLFPATAAKSAFKELGLDEGLVEVSIREIQAGRVQTW